MPGLAPSVNSPGSIAGLPAAILPVDCPGAWWTSSRRASTHVMSMAPTAPVDLSNIPTVVCPTRGTGTGGVTFSVTVSTLEHLLFCSCIPTAISVVRGPLPGGVVGGPAVVGPTDSPGR